MTRTANITLAVINGVLAIFILGDLGESARGDDYMVRAIPYDLLVMASASAVIVIADLSFRRLRRRH